MRKKKKETKVAQAFYLNKFVDVVSRNLVEGHTEKDLQVFNSHDPVCPFHHQSLVVPNGRRARISILLLFVR